MLAQDLLKRDVRSSTPPFSGFPWYILLLLGSKFCRCLGIFFVDILSKQIHVISVLCLLRIISSPISLLIQKPLNVDRIRPSFLPKIFQLSFFNVFIEVLWFYGITLCGPLRSILVFEQNTTLIIVALMALIKGSGSTARSRGVLLLIAGFVILFIMDSDALPDAGHSEEHKHQGGLNHIFYHLISLIGVSDHIGGLFLLIFALACKVKFQSSFRQLAVELGGSKRLNALISLLSALFLIPLAILSIIFTTSHVQSYFEFVFIIVLASLFIMVIDFYSDFTCLQHISESFSCWSQIFLFVAALAISFLWSQHHSSSEQDIDINNMNNKHSLNFGSCLATISFCFAAYLLSSQKSQRSMTGHFIGVSEDGMPLYTRGEAFLKRTSRSLLRIFHETLNEILADSDSRRIFWFLCANLAFCGIEFLYGFLTNSLGLISDGFHMLFDCSALVMGLIASVMSRWTASKDFSYGYGRVEVLSGFINALFLIVIAFFIFIEALERLYDPPNIQTDKLMIVAIAGLFVNLFGMYAFHGAGHGHSHGGSGSGTHSHGHSHTNEDKHHKHRHSGGKQAHDYNETALAHSHDHGGHHHGHSHGGNANMRGVFLHVLADTLGSVFVIISTFFIQTFGWQWVDPLCSLILSILIVGSVCPLLKSSAFTLLQSIPEEISAKSDEIGEQILHIEGVRNYTHLHVWQLKSGVNVASIHIEIGPEANEQIVRGKVSSLLRQYDAVQSTVQVEKSTSTNAGVFHHSPPPNHPVLHSSSAEQYNHRQCKSNTPTHIVDMER